MQVRTFRSPLAVGIHFSSGSSQATSPRHVAHPLWECHILLSHLQTLCIVNVVVHEGASDLGMV